MMRARRLSVLVVVLVFVAAGCEWPMFGFGPSGGRASPDTSMDAGSWSQGLQVFREVTGGAVRSSPAVAGGIV
jgi:hypothetical protein